MIDFDRLTDIVLQRCDELAECSDDSSCLTRTFLSPAMRAAHEWVRQWLTVAGLEVRMDAIGNIIGRKQGATPRVFVVASHIDTVPNAGKYDGALGVLLGIAAAEALSNRTFRRTLDVIAFSEEEGVRYRTPYLGSRAVCGLFSDGLLDLFDSDGHMMEQAIRDYGLNPADISRAKYPHDTLAGYFEAHIEQGPILESLNASLGIVTAIAGQCRYHVRFVGCAGHAGTQPMELRRDALAAAAQFITFVETTANEVTGLRATVGVITALPGAVNVVPGEVQLSLDVRHELDQTRSEVVQRMFTHARSIGHTRHIAVDFALLLEEKAVACDAGMTLRLTESTRDAGYVTESLISGAGHDAVIMSSRCPTSMLFLRSPRGISHHPDESVRREDVRAALDVMIRFLANELDRE